MASSNYIVSCQRYQSVGGRFVVGDDAGGWVGGTGRYKGEYLMAFDGKYLNGTYR
jgi:hypothetical protein